MRAEIEPVVDELRHAGLRWRCRLLVGGNDQIAEHLHGAPLVIVEDLALICLLAGAGGGRGCACSGLRLRGRGSGRGAQNLKEIAAADVHGLPPRDSVFLTWSAMYSDGPPAQRGDGQRRILVGVADKRRGVGDEQILAVPRLAILIQHGGLGIVAHLRGAHFVDDLAAARDAPVACRPMLA